MQEAVSTILLGRSREAEGLSRMITVSLGAHAIVLVALALVPSNWLTSPVERSENALIISFAPAGTQDTGGMTPMASRTVQETTADARNVTRTPAAPPEMTAPAPETKPAASKPLPKPPDPTATKKPATGKEVQTGPARADTPATSQPAFGSLSQSSAGGPGGVRVEGNFCCPEYLEQMKRAIMKNWNQNVGVAGTVEVKFVIRRDGMITNVAVSQTSHNPILDLESRQAVLLTQNVGALPDRYTPASLPVYLIFEYKR
jgi:outer membrane biosynthesis protein TonB